MSLNEFSPIKKFNIKNFKVYFLNIYLNIRSNIPIFDICCLQHTLWCFACNSWYVLLHKIVIYLLLIFSCFSIFF